jgi:endo-1,4-beta-xylanase
MGFPTMAQLDSTITAFGALGVQVHVTELDVDVLPAATSNTGADVSLRAAATPATNPYTAGLPDSVQERLAQRYADAFRVYLKHRDVIDRVTLWGVSDGDSWLNGWPVRGRTNHPLLFDRQLRPKPAFDRIVELAKQGPLVP